ncbi:MAG: oxidoreductase [Hyphomicrobiales bacterium]|nr:oxidoreductase [Hyphomicrobiales bacterium]
MPSKQIPFGSGFGAANTAEEVIGDIDLRGKTALITGGYSGLGLETARVLAKAGAKVIVPARDREKAKAALSTIPDVELEVLDLMAPAFIDALADRFLASGRPLHILINSAGIMASPLKRDARGFEAQFSTNHLGHFQLTARLLPALQRAEGARVVSVSSRGHRIGGIDFEDPNFVRRDYDKWVAYGQSKTANALFALGLDGRGEAHGIRAFSLHPGTILTDLARSLSDAEIKAFDVHDADGTLRVDPEGDLKSVGQGAATSVWCATSPQLVGRGGVYCENCDIAELAPVGDTRKTGVRPWAADPILADRLWSLSEDRTGVRWDW